MYLKLSHSYFHVCCLRFRLIVGNFFLNTVDTFRIHLLLSSRNREVSTLAHVKNLLLCLSVSFLLETHQIFLLKNLLSSCSCPAPLIWLSLSDTVRPEVFYKKDSSLKPATLLKKIIWRRCFPVNFANFLSLCPLFFIFSPNDSPSKTMKNTFYFI